MREMKQQQTMTEAEWQELGQDLFGADLAKWRFCCPTCSNVMSIEKARTMPVEQLERLRGSKWSIEQECVGRYVDFGCNWCAYGLFSGPFFVVRGSCSKTPVFGFDMASAAGHSPGHNSSAPPASDPPALDSSSCAKGDSNPHGALSAPDEAADWEILP